jgi:hypothetical protein
MGFFMHTSFYLKEENIMIEGLAITPVVLRWIRVGKMVEKNSKCIPEKYDLQ